MKDAPNAIDTLFLQPWQSVKSRKFTKNTWHQPVSDIHIPHGSGVDRRFPDEDLRAHRQADPRVAWPRSAAVWWT